MSLPVYPLTALQRYRELQLALAARCLTELRDHQSGAERSHGAMLRTEIDQAARQLSRAQQAYEAAARHRQNWRRQLEQARLRHEGRQRGATVAQSWRRLTARLAS